MEELRIKLDDIDHIVLHGGKDRKTAQQVLNALKDKPDFIVNAAMYDMKSGLTISDTIIDNKVINGGNYTDRGIAFNDNDLTQTTTPVALATGFNYFLAGSPNLVENGAVNIDCKGFSTWFITKGQSKRLAMGFDNNELLFYFPKQAMTITELADDMMLAGMKTAINLDGGGSTMVCQVENGKAKALNEPTENRLNSTWLLIYLKQNRKEENKMKVVIDAGHGAETAGKKAFDGSFYEYIFNRNVANRLKYHLERHGVEVILTAKTNEDISLEERCNISNKVKPNCFVSIHANAFGSDWNGVNGWEIYIVGKGGNAEKLAKSIQLNSKALGLKDRGIKVSDFYVLRKTDAPAVLIEHGFYTNKQELEKLKTEAFQEQCAVCDAKGILEHLGIIWVEEIGNEVSSWAAEAQKWVIANKISDGTRPKDTITREEVWAMLMNMSK